MVVIQNPSCDPHGADEIQHQVEPFMSEPLVQFWLNYFYLKGMKPPIETGSLM
jgi:hypothetical protein